MLGEGNFAEIYLGVAKSNG